MCANSQSNWLNTIAVRASYILPILKRQDRFLTDQVKLNTGTQYDVRKQIPPM